MGERNQWDLVQPPPLTNATPRREPNRDKTKRKKRCSVSCVALCLFLYLCLTNRHYTKQKQLILKLATLAAKQTTNKQTNASFTTMSAVREVKEILFFELDPTNKKRARKPFSATLPGRFLEYEGNPARILSLWNDSFVAAVNALCRARQNRFLDEHMGTVVFRSGMETTCQDFSRRTDSVKVELVERQVKPKSTRRLRRGSPKTTIEYRLRLTKLSDIPQVLRRPQQFCLAEIPALIEEVRAEVVGTTAAGERLDDDIPMVTVELAGRAHGPLVIASTASPCVRVEEHPSCYNVNPPIAACQVVPILVDPTEHNEEGNNIDKVYNVDGVPSLRSLSGSSDDVFSSQQTMTTTSR